MKTSPNISLTNSKPAPPLWAALPLALALAVFPNSNASAQLAVDKIHGYAIDGYAMYTPTGTGHTGQAGDAAMDLGTSGGTLLTVSDPAFFGALNAGVAGDQLSVSLWVQLSSISAASGFWFFSPTLPANQGQRGFQAHLPWSDDTIYFDTAGCCDGGTQRISANINTLPAWIAVGGDTWWNSWHHFVFLKNAADKQVWIDGVLFLEGQNTGPLPTDFNLLSVGSGLPPPSGAASLKGQIDDFAVFTSALSSNQVHALFTGTTPDALTGVTPLAYWDFNPKTVLDTVQAGPGASVTPDISAYFVIANGSSAVQLNTIRVGVNNSNVTAQATILPTARPPLLQGSTAGATIYYASPTVFAPGTTQTVWLAYSDNASPPNVYSNSWPVVIEGVNGYVTDVANNHLGFLEGSAVFTLDKGGHTGTAGDRAIDLSGVGSGGAVHVGTANFVNRGATNDTLSVSLWMKYHHIGASTAVWARSASAGGMRGFTAQPWSDDNIYFDTAGCCDLSLQRIVAPISYLPNYGDDSFWTSWHNYVFIYNAGEKQIWIDGWELADGFSSAPLPMDFGDMFFGWDTGSAYAQALIDDVAVFATPLSAASIASLRNGNLPTALAGETVLAYWDFNTISPGPPFISLASTPAPGSTNSLPNVGANIIIVNRDTQVLTNTIRITLDTNDVTSLSTITTNSAGANITFLSPTILPALSTHRVTVVFSDNATPPSVVSNSWTFAIGPYSGYARDALHSYLGMFMGNTHYTANGGGHTGQPGDYAVDMTEVGGPVHIYDATFLYPAEINNTMTFSFWLKKYDIASSSAFWVNSPSSSGGGRGFQAHVPWSNDNIYFDTSGCCDGFQRISGPISGFSGYTDDSFWTNWHHFVFLYNDGEKDIWIDGQLFLVGYSSSPLALDFTDMFLGRDVADDLNMHGQMDDFAAFATPVTFANIARLAQGTLPTALVGEKLLAYWNFNDVPAGPTISIARTNNNLVITYVGTLQSATNVTGTYTDMTGAPNPYTTTATGQRMFYRARQ